MISWLAGKAAAGDTNGKFNGNSIRPGRLQYPQGIAPPSQTGIALSADFPG